MVNKIYTVKNVTNKKYNMHNRTEIIIIFTQAEKQMVK